MSIIEWVYFAYSYIYYCFYPLPDESSSRLYTEDLCRKYDDL